MKINGQTPPPPNSEPVVLPRPSRFEPDPKDPTKEIEIPGDIVFECRAVLDFSDFDKTCPEPKPKMSLRPGQSTPTPNLNSPEFLKELQSHSMKKQNWMMIKSISESDGLEWETVDLDDPETWHLWPEELKSAGITIGETLRIQQTIIRVNGLDDAKFEEARKAFLASKRQKQSS